VSFIPLEGRVDVRQSVRALQPRQVVVLGGPAKGGALTMNKIFLFISTEQIEENYWWSLIDVIIIVIVIVIDAITMFSLFVTIAPSSQIIALEVFVYTQLLR
jgi:hypothetical protein